MRVCGLKWHGVCHVCVVELFACLSRCCVACTCACDVLFFLLNKQFRYRSFLGNVVLFSCRVVLLKESDIF